MPDNFKKEIESLKESLIKMASLVDEQVGRATRALETGDVELCKGIKAKDKEIDAYEILINTKCENILALFHPVASDLRFIMSTLLINTQLERCGDIAVNIAQRVKKTKGFHELIVESKVIEMGNKARSMVKEAIESFINGSTEQAENVLRSDEIVDNLNKDIFDFLTEKMQSDASLIETGSHLVILTKHIERLADHATNIAEDLVYYIEAEFISHKRDLSEISE